MDIRIEHSLARSPLTGKILSRISFVAESSVHAYYATSMEGYSISSVMTDRRETPRGRSILKKLTKIMEEREELINALFLASDFDAFRNGRPAPIACARLETLKRSVEGITI